MTDPKRKYYEKRANVLIKNLRSRHFAACYCADKAEALKKALEWIPAGSSVGWGGAMSAQQIGLLDTVLTGDYRALDRERVWEFTPTAAAGDKVRAGDAIGYGVTMSANPSDLINGATSVEYIANVTAASLGK